MRLTVCGLRTVSLKALNEFNVPWLCEKASVFVLKLLHLTKNVQTREGHLNSDHGPQVGLHWVTEI